MKWISNSGNRLIRRAGGGATGLEPRYANYTVNSLNQYTQRTVPGYTAVMGTAHSNAVVTLVDSAGNSARALRQQEHFFGELPVTNYLGPVWLGITNYAVLDTETEQVFTNSSGAVLVPPTPQAYSHDGNGNLLSDGLWVRTWNAENRMTRIESGMGIPAHARKREDWTYLPDGRWIERIVSTNNGSAYYPAFTNRYVWDGKVLLAILDNNNEPIMTFLRGADLSGTIEGAGGVGGVLAVSFYGSESSTHFVSYDGNGNVIALTDAATAETTAVFEYGPFGELLRSTGPMADQMPLRFSTMYADDVTGDVKYFFRDLTTPEGRWTSRDPVGQRGGKNLLVFARNNPPTFIDRLGLIDVGVIDVPRWGPKPEELWAGFWVNPSVDEVRQLSIGTTPLVDKGFHRGAMIVRYNAYATIVNCKTRSAVRPRSRDLYFVNHFNARSNGELAGAALAALAVDSEGNVSSDFRMYIEPANASFKAMFKNYGGNGDGSTFGHFHATVEMKIVDADAETSRQGLMKVPGFSREMDDIDGHEIGASYLGYTAGAPPAVWLLPSVGSFTIQIGFEWDNCCGHTDWKWGCNVNGSGPTRFGEPRQTDYIDLNARPVSGSW